jgi:predicted transposase/invertase (TIGR01784 family)
MSKNKKQTLPSDALFRKIMSQKGAAIDFLKCYLPEELQNMVDLSSVEVLKDNFVEDTLKRRISDIIYSIKPKRKISSDGQENKEIYAIVILEHQSTVDKLIAFRLWKYAILLMERYLENSKNYRLSCL